MKEPKKTKSSYMIIAAALLAIGGVARVLVGNSAKVETPKTTTPSTTSSIEINEEENNPQENIYDITEQELIDDTAKLSSESTETSDDTKDLGDETANTESETKPAAAEVIKYAMPIKGNVSKSYSTNSLIYSKTYDDMRTHNGIDILAETGTVVKPIAKGSVKDVYEDLLLGNTVVIDHGDQVYSYYSGLNDVSVKKGDDVSATKVIGTVGEVPSECLDAPHLHLMIKKGNEYQSPLKFMGLE